MGKASGLKAVARGARMARVLAELEQTGRATASCLTAGVHPGTVCEWRKKYADFAEAWSAALARFTTARMAALAQPARTTRYARWTAGKIDRFIDRLAATGSEMAAARAVGMSRVAVYRLRRRDAAFRAAWASAVDQGYAQVEIGMIDEAINGVPPRADGDRPAGSERLRNSVYQAGMRRAAMLRGASEDEAERDRNEAIAAKWIADFRTMVERFEAAHHGDAA